MRKPHVIPVFVFVHVFVDVFDVRYLMLPPEITYELHTLLPPEITNTYIHLHRRMKENSLPSKRTPHSVALIQTGFHGGIHLPSNLLIQVGTYKLT